MSLDLSKPIFLIAGGLPAAVHDVVGHHGAILSYTPLAPIHSRWFSVPELAATFTNVPPDRPRRLRGQLVGIGPIEFIEAEPIYTIARDAVKVIEQKHLMGAPGILRALAALLPEESK